MLGRQVRFLQHLTSGRTSAQRQRLISSMMFIAPVSPHHPLRVFLRLIRLFLALRYATVYTAVHPDADSLRPPRYSDYSPSLPDYDDYGYRSSVPSSNTKESRETFSTSTRAHVPRSPQVTSTRVNQSTIGTTATADHPYGNPRPCLAAPYSAEFTLTGPASSPTWASYQRTPSPDDDFGYPDFPPTHSYTFLFVWFRL
jgi:hypothetical protein